MEGNCALLIHLFASESNSFFPRHQNFLSTRARDFPPAALLMYISLRGLRSTRWGSELRLHFGLSGRVALFLAGGVGRRQESDDEQMRQQSLLVCLEGSSSLAPLPWEKRQRRRPGRGPLMSQTRRRMEPQVEVIISRARSWLHTSGLRARLASAHTWDFWLEQRGLVAAFHPEMCRRGSAGCTEVRAPGRLPSLPPPH